MLHIVKNLEFVPVDFLRRLFSSLVRNHQENLTIASKTQQQVAVWAALPQHINGMQHCRCSSLMPSI